MPVSESGEKWSSKAQFLLACVGYTVEVGAVWRFPIICYINGGGAFLIPYFISLVFMGVPLLYMEMAVGQLTRKGPIHALAMLCPLLKGAGIAMVLSSFAVCTYYAVLIVWPLLYLSDSFYNPLPWMTCQNDWNTNNCWDSRNDIINEDQKTTGGFGNEGYVDDPLSVSRKSPSSEYFERRVLGHSDGEVGGLNNELVGYLFLAWFICFCCISMGVKSLGKVVYVTTILRYVILLILLVRSVTLPGAVDGIRYLFTPEWNKLLDPEVWMEASFQVFLSTGIGYGSLIVFASYNRKSNNIYHDTLAIAILNISTSLLSGLVVFSALGGMANILQISVAEVYPNGQDLVFVIVPALFALLPAANLWAVLFFMMFISLGLGFQLGLVELITKSIMDLCDRCLQGIKIKRLVIAFCVCLAAFLLGLPCLLKGDSGYLTYVDISSWVSIVNIAHTEVLAISLLFGANRLAREISFLSGYRPYYFFPFCWFFITPVLLTMLASYKYRIASEYFVHSYVDFTLSQVIGYVVGSIPTICIPIGVMYVLCCGRGTCCQNLVKSVTPTFVPHYMKRANRTDEESTAASNEGGVHYNPASTTELCLLNL